MFFGMAWSSCLCIRNFLGQTVIWFRFSDDLALLFMFLFFTRNLQYWKLARPSFEFAVSSLRCHSLFDSFFVLLLSSIFYFSSLVFLSELFIILWWLFTWFMGKLQKSLVVLTIWRFQPDCSEFINCSGVQPLSVFVRQYFTWNFWEGIIWHPFHYFPCIYMHFLFLDGLRDSLQHSKFHSRRKQILSGSQGSLSVCPPPFPVPFFFPHPHSVGTRYKCVLSPSTPWRLN